MRELIDKRLMLEDVKSWVAMDSYEQHLINNMSEWIENLPTVEVSDVDCISRRAALDAMKKITFPHWFECGEYLSEDTREIEIINSKKALEVIEALPSAQPEPSEITDEQAILHLQSTGWMQNHDREIYESGLKERLADDSESYDSLIPHEDDGDTISRQAAIGVVNNLIDRFERILRDIRESKGDDSVCGMCEYDGAYIGQSGDWCNECPGFDKDDCFKLSDECRKRWMGDIALPSVQPDHVADISKKVSISCGQENDLISRQAAIDAMKAMYRAAEKWLRDATDDVTKARAESCMASLVEIKLRTEKLSAAQPEPCVNTIDALNESIKHFDDMAEECRRNANIERNDYMDMRDDAAEYRQLSIWLNELKWLRERFQSQPEIIRCKDCKHWIRQTNCQGAPLSFALVK